MIFRYFSSMVIAIRPYYLLMTDKGKVKKSILIVTLGASLFVKDD